MDPDLIKITEIFLISCSFLVTALGTADTNYHRAGVSLLGLIVSVLWLVCSREAVSEIVSSGPKPVRAARIHILAWLPILFIVGWLVSASIHGWLCRYPSHF